MGLASFYRKSLRNFGTITTPITDCLRKKIFVWSKEEELGFLYLKKLLKEELVLCLPDFDKIFEVELASIVGVGTILSQVGHLVAYFNVYHLELYAIVRDCQT